ncbi:acetylornithine deacetylase [Phyllobacterium chamaecytisi]|uniref:acetylornithine deacetylase n=1 Tax=Phyllobacterium chamaecytisi TaxID=2876082 RepID=UPI001CCE14A2|nr:acetylornithine deacetylase [Phyllobacterium sp. KW56]
MQTLEVLDRLVAFPTVSADTNLPLINFIRSYLTGCGFECRLLADETGRKASLFATIGPNTGNGIILSGHTDVVPVSGQDWSTNPFALVQDNDRVFGRGTTDMKGFLAAALAAAAKVRQASLSRPLHLAFSYDEEIGCVGIRPLLEDLAGRKFKAALCIVGEPTSMQVVTGHKGKVSARAHCQGVGGHSSMAPNYLNAIHLACDFVGKMRARQWDLEESGVRDSNYDIPYTTIHAGIISGGKTLNIVADKAFVDFEIRNVAQDDPGRILDQLREDAQTTVDIMQPSFPAAHIEIEVLNSYPGLLVQETDPVVSSVARLAKAGATAKVSFGTEAGLFASMLEIPTVVLGPGSMAQGHTPNEFIMLEQLAKCDAMMDRLIASLCET